MLNKNIPTFEPLIEFVNENSKTQELISPPSSQLVYKKKETSLLCYSTKPQGFKSKVLNCVIIYVIVHIRYTLVLSSKL